MTTLLIIGIMIIILLGAATYGLLAMNDTLTQQIDRLAIQTRLDDAARAVTANIITTSTTAGPRYYVPMVSDVTKPTVPGWIYSHAVTPEGISFAYCPFSNGSISGLATAILTASGGYDVVTATPYTGARSYVYESDARPTNASTALAIIVAPLPGQTAAGDCTTIAADGTIDGNMVRVITQADIYARDTITASNGQELYVDTSATGDGTGRNENNFASFATAMQYTNQYRPRYIKLNLDAGTYSTSQSQFSQTFISTRPEVNNRRSAYEFRGEGKGVTILSTSSSFDQRFLGDVYFYNLSHTSTSNQSVRLNADRNSTMIFDTVGLGVHYGWGGANIYLLGGAVDQTNTTTDGRATYYDSSQLYIGTTYNLLTGASYYAGNYSSQSMQYVLGSAGTLVFNTTGSGCAGYTYGQSHHYYLGTATSTGGTAYPVCGYNSQEFYYSGATITNFGDRLVATPGLVVVDNGTVITDTSTNPARHFPSYFGTRILLTDSTLGSPSTSSNRPSSENFLLDISSVTYSNGAYSIGGGTLGGWPQAALAIQSGGNNCWHTTKATSHYVAGDTNTGNGAESTARGTSGYEYQIILNRSNWSCTKS